jgi:hypothetical protein
LWDSCKGTCTTKDTKSTKFGVSIIEPFVSFVISFEISGRESCTEQNQAPTSELLARLRERATLTSILSLQKEGEEVWRKIRPFSCSVGERKLMNHFVVNAFKMMVPDYAHRTLKKLKI